MATDSDEWNRNLRGKLEGLQANAAHAIDPKWRGMPATIGSFHGAAVPGGVYFTNTISPQSCNNLQRSTVSNPLEWAMTSDCGVVSLAGPEPDPRETLNRIIAGAINEFAQRMTGAQTDPQSMAAAAGAFLDSHGCKFTGEPPKDWAVMIDQLVDDDHPSDMYDDLASLVDRHWDETTPGELMVAMGCVIQEREQAGPELPEGAMHQTMADAFAAGFVSLRSNCK